MIEHIRQFYTLTNLQGSQTASNFVDTNTGFTLLQTYKVLKLVLLPLLPIQGFTLLQTYKVLKHLRTCNCNLLCFTLLQTYKVLKHH